MKKIENQTFDQERALYGSEELHAVGCVFDGPADGESAFKECRDIRATDCVFRLRYPFWHDEELEIENCDMTDSCRAALWYSRKIRIADSRLHGIKALRECGDVTMTGCDVISEEFGWSTRGLTMSGCSVRGEYFMMRSDHLHFTDVRLKGKYSFQYIEDSEFDGCEFDTKDAFWHAKNVTVRNSVIRGEYLAWYCENVTFENCLIVGTQPLCYCQGLKLINCRMQDADLCFERSEVEATVTTPVDSIKNPRAGYIRVQSCGQLIYDDPNAEGVVVTDAGTDMENAERIFQTGRYTCVLCRGSAVMTTTQRGVKPLMRILEQGGSVAGFAAADRVIGKATAFLYCLLGVAEVYGEVISEGALEVLRNHGIPARCLRRVERIINRSGDGICPFEAAVSHIHDPESALPAIRDKMKELNISL